MEAAILAAEETVAARQVEVEAASTAGHAKLNAACLALDDARGKVETLFARWEKLAAKRGG